MIPEVKRNQFQRTILRLATMLFVVWAGGAGCFPDGGSTNTNDNTAHNGECTFPPCPQSTACEQDQDCACGVHVDTGACFVGNVEFVDTDPARQCPDFCSGIAGNFVTRCVDSVCELTTE